MTNDEKVKQAVRKQYGKAAAQFIDGPELTARGSSGCCGPEPSADNGCGCSDGLYPAEAIDELPGSVTEASLGCGNPTALASLKPGETVLDLGSGGGIDCFLAARNVGPEGHVTGLDMTPEMIKLARQNAKKVGLDNVDFRFGEMEDMPVRSRSMDVIISNCVINLSPDKDAVFAEAYRVLKPGGRLAVSDIVTDGPLPDSVRQDSDAWSGCVAGALEESVYLEKMRRAGFTDIEVTGRSVGQDLPISVAIPDADGNPVPIEELAAEDEFMAALATKVASISVVARKA